MTKAKPERPVVRRAAVENALIERNELCLVIGISDNSLTTAVRHGFIRAESRGLYPLGESIRGWLRYQKSLRHGARAGIPADQEGDDGPPKIATTATRRVEAEMRLAEEKAALAELERRQKTGELVPVDMVTEAMFMLVAVAKARLRGMGAKLAPDLALAKSEKEIVAIIEPEVDDALSRLAGLSDQLAADD